MKHLINIICLNCIIINCYCQIHSYFPQESTNCIVLLEKKIDTSYIPHATGFLLYSYKKDFSYYLITCEHALRNPDIYIKIPATAQLVDSLRKYNKRVVDIRGMKWELVGNSLRYKYSLIKDKTYWCDKKNDIGILKITAGFKIVYSDSTEFYLSDRNGIPKSWIKFRNEVPLGTDIYFIGFPFAIGTELGWYPGVFTGKYSNDIPNPLVRKGAVAWSSTDNPEFLLDAFSYSGNSGSPIFTIQDIQNKSALIGIVVGHLPSDKSENIGLARSIWIDEIINLIERLE